MITVGAIVQARMGSTRLPGKTMMPLNNKPMLQFLLERLQQSKRVDKIVVATSIKVENKVIVELAQKMGVDCFVGSEDDVLDRYYQAAKKFGLLNVVRITADCPLTDPRIVDEVIDKFFENKVDYANNVDPRSFPDGFDVEVFTFSALEKAWRESKSREHVTTYIRESKIFKKSCLKNPVDLSNIRLTVDTRDDYEKVKWLVECLPASFGLNEVLVVKSQELLQRAKVLIPCQAQTMSKNWTQFVQGVCPVYLEKGDGCCVWDVDGNKYVDYITGLGTIILGYNYGVVNDAIKKQLGQGISFSLPHPLEVELAEELKKVIPCAEMVRYGKNGSDATAACVRIARAFTGREMIACCGYHGWQDWYITTTNRNKGVPKVMSDLIKSFEYNKLETLQKLFDEHPGRIAAIIMEPISTEEPKDDFLQKVKELVHKNGALLIFDEVVTGFRLAMGGAQEYYGVVPDIASFGKAIGNGMPLSIVAGKKEVMQTTEDVFFSLTFGGETLSLATARAVIKEMQDKKVIEHIWKMGTMLKNGVIKAIKERDLPIKCVGLPVHFVLDCGESLELKSLLIQEMARRGILMGGYFNICFMHKEKEIKRTLSAFDEVCVIMKKAVLSGNIKQFLLGSAVQPVFRKL